jgi:hypothetical protein
MAFNRDKGEIMRNKPYYFYVLTLYFGLGIAIPSTYAALDCRYEAYIHVTADIKKVQIWRADLAKYEPASRENDGWKLCECDKVIVPDSLSYDLEIGYYSRQPSKMLKAGEHQMCQDAIPCLKCFLMMSIQKIEHLWPLKGNPSEEHIIMPLVAGEGEDYPFYLFAHSKGAISIFWYGKQSPYQLKVETADKVIVPMTQVTVPETEEKATFSFTVPHTEPGSKYTLTIQSAEAKVFKKVLEFAEPPQFKADPQEDQWMRLTRLLAVCDGEESQNWRLEIWRQLNAMPDSKRKKNFMDHLDVNDIYLDDFGLCQ